MWFSSAMLDIIITDIGLWNHFHLYIFVHVGQLLEKLIPYRYFSYEPHLKRKKKKYKLLYIYIYIFMLFQISIKNIEKLTR